jgi:hypothetical protein
MPDQGDVLAEAASRAASELQLSTAQYADALGIEVADKGGVYATEAVLPIDPQSKAGKRGLQLIQIYQRLHAQTGNDRVAIAHWMMSENRQLGSKPIDLVRTTDGMGQITAYLESLKP